MAIHKNRGTSGVELRKDTEYVLVKGENTLKSKQIHF